jgi:hypothetical protein
MPSPRVSVASGARSSPPNRQTSRSAAAAPGCAMAQWPAARLLPVDLNRGWQFPVGASRSRPGRLRRWPTEVTPISLKSSAVRRGSTLASTSLSRPRANSRRSWRGRYHNAGPGATNPPIAIPPRWPQGIRYCLPGHLAAMSAPEGEAAGIAGKRTYGVLTAGFRLTAAVPGTGAGWRPVARTGSQRSSSSKALASLTSAVLNPSVNQP